VSILPGIYASQITGHLVTSSYDSIATVNVGSGGASSVSFTSIPSTYKHLQIRLIGKSDRSTNALSSIGLQFNSDGTGTNYDIHEMYGTGSAAASAYGANSNAYDRISGNTGATNIFGAMIFDILDYTNTNKYKTVRMLGGVDFNGSGEVDFMSGLWLNTSAITRIDFLPSYQSTQFQQYSSFALYGIRG